MTNLEALKAMSGGYPISENSFLLILTDRKIEPAGDYTEKTQAFELAVADIYKMLVTSINITEGGFTVSVTEKANLSKMANAIYSKYGETGSLTESKPQIKNRSYLW